MGQTIRADLLLRVPGGLDQSLLASASQVRSGETGTQKHHGRGFWNCCWLRSNRKDNAVVPEVAVWVEAERQITAVENVAAQSR